MSELLPQRRGLGASLISVAYGIGGAIGALLSSRLAALFGWRYAFLAVGIIAVTDMLVQLFFIRERHRPHSARRSGSFRAALSFSLLLLAVVELRRVDTYSNAIGEIAHHPTNRLDHERSEHRQHGRIILSRQFVR
jgi:MFS family permease